MNHKIQKTIEDPNTKLVLDNGKLSKIGEDLDRTLNEIYAIKHKLKDLRQNQIIEMMPDVSLDGTPKPSTFDIPIKDIDSGKRIYAEVKTKVQLVVKDKDLNEGPYQVIQKINRLERDNLLDNDAKYEAVSVIEFRKKFTKGNGDYKFEMTINNDGTYKKYYPVLDKVENGDLIKEWVSTQLNKGIPENNSKLDKIIIINKNGKHVRTIIKEDNMWRVE